MSSLTASVLKSKSQAVIQKIIDEVNKELSTDPITLSKLKEASRIMQDVTYAIKNLKEADRAPREWYTPK